MKTDRFYKKCIADILAVGADEVRFDNPPSYIEEGTKSIIRDVLCRGKDYIFKKYNEEAIDLSKGKSAGGLYDEFLRDIVSLHILNRGDYGAVPKIVSYDYEPFRKEMAILMETIPAKTLKEAMRNSHSEEQWANLSRAFSTFKQALGIMQENGAAIEEELLRVSDGRVKLKNKSAKDYAKSQRIYSEILGKGGYGLGGLEDFQKQFPKLAAKYFEDPSMRKIGPSDLYPHNITLESLIDFGTIGHVSLPLLLGCMFCNPSVFNTLGSRKEDRNHKLGYFIEDLCYSEMLNPSLKQKALEGTYVGGVFGNLRVAAGLVKRKTGDPETVKKFIDSSKKQAKELKSLGVI